MAAKPIGHRVILSQRASIIDPRSTVPYRAIALGTTPSCWKNFLPSQQTSLFSDRFDRKVSLPIASEVPVFLGGVTTTFVHRVKPVHITCLHLLEQMFDYCIIRHPIFFVNSFYWLIILRLLFCLRFIVCQSSPKKTVVHKFFTIFLGTHWSVPKC